MSITSKLIGRTANVLGNVLIILRPKIAHQLSENRIALIHKNKNNLSLQEKLIRYALIQKLEKTQDHNKIAELNRDYWAHKSTEIIKELEDGFKTDFLPNCTFIFDLLKKEISNHPDQFKVLVEIGTGNGDVLNYLSSEFPEINSFIGIDLSVEQTEINRQKYTANKKLDFVSADAVDWVKEHGVSNTIFVTSRGVLEYFEQQQLQEFLKKINQLGKTIFVAIEPNGENHNLETTHDSQIYGLEPSFSHNYPYLFEKAGFNLWHFSQKPWFEATNIQTFIGAKN
ncbi:class I SAM-dependent methyltransferase [Winogradskyella ludwigii]|uniref:class I SAM-dependent methyltransferase n=1 Tax=Winogradskyella ludwigii TaxID=2686076 RepID=UPI0015CD0095|nr:class I SAM-dependent methyltransferase [Winogradskyella ludwigii]